MTTVYSEDGGYREVEDAELDSLHGDGKIDMCMVTSDWYAVECLTMTHDRRGREAGLVCEAALERNYRFCEFSDRWMLNSEFMQSRVGPISLYQYREEEFFACTNCGDVCPPDDYVEDDTCNRCCDDDDGDGDGARGIIREYHSQDACTVLGFFNADGTKDYRRSDTYFGVELEVECSEDRAESAARVNAALDGRTLFQTDGSLLRGYEIITAPMALSAQREMWGKFSLLVARGLRSHNTSTCGMHVHVSASAVSPLQLGRILVFVNDPGNAPFVDCVAQRDSKEYAQKSKKKLTAAQKRGNGEGHFDAVNIGNSATIEFRIFKGNLRPDRIIKNLEFVAALLDYCKGAGSSELLTVPFLAWCARAENRKTYPMLYAYLCEKGYATPYSKKCKESRSQPNPEGN